MAKLVYTQEDFITYENLVQLTTEDPTHGVYVVNTAYEEVDTEEFRHIGVNSPLEGYRDTGIKGAVFLEITNERNKDNSISIPPVDIPFNLIEFGGKVKDIIVAHTFVNACRKGIISLLSKEAYEKISNNPVVQAKRDALRESMGAKYFGAGEDKKVVIDRLNKDLSGTKIKKAKAMELSPIVADLCNKSDEISHNDQYRRYLAVEDRLTKEDLLYLVQNCHIAKIKESAEDYIAAE